MSKKHAFLYTLYLNHHGKYFFPLFVNHTSMKISFTSISCRC